MNQTDKERLGLSVVLALVINAAILLGTGWVQMFRPTPAKPYEGPLFVEISAPVSAPSTFRSTETTKSPSAPVETQPTKSEPVTKVIVTPPVQKPVQKPAPEIVPTNTETPSATSLAPPPARTASSATSQAKTTVTAPSQPSPVKSQETGTGSGRQAPPQTASITGGGTARATAPSATAGGGATVAAQGSAATGNSTGGSVEDEPFTVSSSPVVSEKPQSSQVPEQSSYTGTSDTVNNAPSAAGTTQFQAVPDKTPTGQFGQNKIVYGEEQGTGSSSTPATETQPAGAGQGQGVKNIIEPSLQKALENLGTGPAEGSGSLAAGTTEAGTGSGSAGSGGTSGARSISARSIAELNSQRGILKRVDPKLPPGALEAGQTELRVPVHFTINQSGLVINPELDQSSGYTEVDALILQALRQWKFQPVSTPGDVEVKLLYIITTK